MTSQRPAKPCNQDVYTSRDGGEQFRYVDNRFVHCYWRGAASGEWQESPAEKVSKNSGIAREMSEYLRLVRGDIVHVVDNWYLVWSDTCFRFELRPVPNALARISMIAPVTILLTAISPADVQEYLLSEAGPAKDEIADIAAGPEKCGAKCAGWCNVSGYDRGPSKCRRD